MRGFSLIRDVSAILSILYFATNCVWAHKPEANLWEQRRQSLKQRAYSPQLAQLPPASALSATRLSQQLPHIRPAIPQTIQKTIPSHVSTTLTPLFQTLSSGHGKVRAIQTPGTGHHDKTIVHIQDVHLNTEAQKNISGAIQALINDERIDLIALEGAFGPVNLEPFRTFPLPDTTRKVANFLLREHQISGPVHTAFTSSKPVPLIVGVDDRSLYNANVNAYVTAARIAEKARRNITRRKENINRRKHNIFNSDLAKFDNQIQAHRNESISFGEYVKELSKRLQVIPSEMAAFLQALALESSINFTHVEREREALLMKLVPRLSDEESSRFLETGIAYRQGQLRHTDFYVALQELCEEKQTPLSAYPMMAAYLRYILLSESIDAEKLISQAHESETAIYRKLARTTEEQELIAESQSLHLAGKLIDFALTKSEWQAYARQPLSDLTAFEDFYRHAESRDLAMTTNLISAMKQHNAKTAVIVTGGFHATGMRDVFLQAGITTLSFVPQISKLDDLSGSSYLTSFAKEQTPLDRLFQGEKLFLSRLVVPQNRTAIGGLYQLQINSNGREGTVSQTYPRGILTGSFDRDGEFKEVSWDENGKRPGAINDRFNNWLLGKGKGLGWIGFFEGAFRQMTTYASVPVLSIGSLKLLTHFGFVTAPPVSSALAGLVLLAYTGLFLFLSIRSFHSQHLNKGIVMPGSAPVINDSEAAAQATRTASWGYLGILAVLPGLLRIIAAENSYLVIAGWGMVALGIFIGGLAHGIANEWKKQIHSPFRVALTVSSGIYLLILWNHILRTGTGIPYVDFADPFVQMMAALLVVKIIVYGFSWTERGRRSLGVAHSGLRGALEALGKPDTLIYMTSVAFSIIFSSFHAANVIRAAGNLDGWGVLQSGSLSVGALAFSFTLIRLSLLSVFIVGSDLKPVLRDDEIRRTQHFANGPLEKTFAPDQYPDVLIHVPIYTESFDIIRLTLDDSRQEADRYNAHMEGNGSAARAHLVVSDDGLMVLANNDVEGVVESAREKLRLHFGDARTKGGGDPDECRQAVAEGVLTAAEAEVLVRVAYYRRHNVNVAARPKQIREHPSTERKGFFKKPSNLNYVLQGADQVRKTMAEKGISYEISLEELKSADVRYRLGWLNGRFDFAVRDSDLIFALDKDSRVPANVLVPTAHEFMDDPGLGYTQHRTIPTNENESYVARALGISARLHDFVLTPVFALVSGLVEFRGHNGVLRRQTLRENGYWDETGAGEDYHFWMQSTARGWHGKFIAYQGMDFGESVSRSYSEESGRFGRFGFQNMAMMLNPVGEWRSKGIMREDARRVLRSPHLRLTQKMQIMFYFQFYVASAASFFLILGLSFGYSPFWTFVIAFLPAFVTYYVFWLPAILSINLIGPERGATSAAPNLFAFVMTIFSMSLLWAAMPFRILIGVYSFFAGKRPDFPATGVDDMSVLTVRQNWAGMKAEHREVAVLLAAFAVLGVLGYFVPRFSFAVPGTILMVAALTYYLGQPFLMTSLVRETVGRIIPPPLQIRLRALGHMVLYIFSRPVTTEEAVADHPIMQDEPALSSPPSQRIPGLVRSHGVLALILIVSLALRFANLSYNSFYMDEAFNAYVSDFGKNVFFLAGDTHIWPPIARAAYHMAGLEGMRGVAAVFGTITVGLVYRLSQEILKDVFGADGRKRASLFAAATFSFSAPALFTSGLGTYDQMAYMLFVAGVLMLALSLNKNSKLLLVTAAGVLVLAFVTRYMLFLYIPFILAYALFISAVDKRRIPVLYFIIPFLSFFALYALFNLDSLPAAIALARTVGSKMAIGQSAEFVFYQLIERIYPTLLFGFIGLALYSRTMPTTLKAQVKLNLLAVGTLLVGVYHIISRSDLQMAKNLNLAVVFGSILAGVAAATIYQKIQETPQLRRLSFPLAVVLAIPLLAVQACMVVRTDQQWPNIDRVVTSLENSGDTEKRIWSTTDYVMPLLRLKFGSNVNIDSPWYEDGDPTRILQKASDEDIDIVVGLYPEELEIGSFILDYEVKSKILMPHGPPIYIFERNILRLGYGDGTTWVIPAGEAATERFSKSLNKLLGRPTNRNIGETVEEFSPEPDPLEEIKEAVAALRDMKESGQRESVLKAQQIADKGLVLTHEQLLDARLQAVVRKEDLASLRRYLIKAQLQEAHLFVDEENQEIFEQLAEELENEANKNEVSRDITVSAMPDLVVNGEITPDKFFEIVNGMDSASELDYELLVIPQSLVDQLKKSGWKDEATLALLYRTNYITLEDLLGAAPVVRVRNLGLILEMTRITLIGA